MTVAACFPSRSSFRWPGRATAGRGWLGISRAEIDTDLTEAYRGTVSLPFESGEHGRVAVEIVDDWGARA